MDNENRTDEEKETPGEGSEKQDAEKTDQSTDEGAEGDEPKGENVVKQEDDGEEIEDPYDKKVAELEKDNKRKSTALVDKNKTIKDLRKELETKGQGLTQDEVKSLIEETLKPFEATKKEMEEILQLTRENMLKTSIEQRAANAGEAKIIRYFFDKEVNKELPFEKQLEHAVALAKNAISDPKFQAEVAKANQLKAAKGDVSEDAVALGPEATKLANALFQTPKGRQEFAKRLANK